MSVAWRRSWFGDSLNISWRNDSLCCSKLRNLLKVFVKKFNLTSTQTPMTNTIRLLTEALRRVKKICPTPPPHLLFSWLLVKIARKLLNPAASLSKDKNKKRVSIIADVYRNHMLELPPHLAENGAKERILTWRCRHRNEILKICWWQF